MLVKLARQVVAVLNPELLVLIAPGRFGRDGVQVKLAIRIHRFEVNIVHSTF